VEGHTVPVDLKRVQAIFVAATEAASAAGRVAFLDRECGTDADLRQRVDALLKAHDNPGSFLDRPAVAPAPTLDEVPPPGRADVPAAEATGTVIGPYMLLEQLGEGGMGTVFMAEQTHPVQRKVAVKVIKAGMDSRQVIARFEAERQALAMMDHVNIARVFDAGATESGRPYFVMELVRGVPITKYCDDNRLTPRQRLELFVPVCQAIQHAHQKGIIHRDIKPSNVMITLYDGKPVPKVIDFGVAKAIEQKLTERTLFTQFGTLVGTLEYMSPEQAEMSALGVDTRSDIFSLGVLLYELLTGNTPLSHKRVREAAYAEILRLIKEEEPPRPSTRLSDSGEALASISAQRHMEPAKLTKLVRGELDWILMKTLEKDRNRRYETASGFAADVQRYLNDEPVEACPPSAGYRLRKFARRNMRALTMVAVAAAAVLIAATTLAWSVRDRQAREHEISLETARRLALTEQGIRQALDRGTKSSADLHAILKKPGGVQQLLNQPARWELSIKIARAELAQARGLAVRTEGSLDAEWAQAMDKLKQQITSDQAEYDLALRLEKIRMDRVILDGGALDQRKTVDEYRKAFAGMAVLKDDPVAVAARLASSPIKDQLVAALDDWAWVAFTLLEPDLAEQLLALARHLSPDPAWGDRLRRLGVWRDREALHKLVAEAPAGGLSPQLLDLIGSLLRDDKPRMKSWRRRAQAEHPGDFWLNFSLAAVLCETNPLEAAGFYRVALALRPGNSTVYGDLGMALLDQEKEPEAIAAFRKAIELDPKHYFAHSNLGLTLLRQGKLNEAIASIRKAIEINPKFAGAHNHLGNSLLRQGKLDEAIACYRKAIELDPKFADPHTNLGNALREQHRLDEAIAWHRKAIELDPKHVNAHLELGNDLYSQRKLDEAIAWYRKAVELDPKKFEAHFNLGHVLKAQRKVHEAIACFRKAIEIDPKKTEAYIILGNALFSQKKLDEAIACFRKAIELDPKSDHAWQNLGWVQYRAGNWKASIDALETSCKLQNPGDCGQWIVMSLAHGKLANEKDLPEQERDRHKTEARRWYERAVKQIDSWSARGEGVDQEIRAFRAEASKLLGVKEKLK
jgi:eukaryotic-like serine/threonine-protein kinase